MLVCLLPSFSSSESDLLLNLTISFFFLLTFFPWENLRARPAENGVLV